LPWGIGLDTDGNVYVADWRNDRVQKFTSEGKFLAAYGTSGDRDGEFHRPSSVAVDQDGNMYVADWGNNRVQVLGPDGRFRVKLLGDAGLSKWAQEFLPANPDYMEARYREESRD
jgi:sugar lactone lactonase YvrE